VAAREGVVAALCDDFNTPRALATLFELIGTANREALPGAVEAVRDLLPLLGLEGAAAEGGPEPGTEARELLAERERARAERDFARADELRERLGEMGWEVRDGPAGPQLLPRAR
jgi:cysteinyl-tRNA synthetase